MMTARSIWEHLAASLDEAGEPFWAKKKPEPPEKGKKEKPAEPQTTDFQSFADLVHVRLLGKPVASDALGKALMGLGKQLDALYGQADDQTRKSVKGEFEPLLQRIVQTAKAGSGTSMTPELQKHVSGDDDAADDDGDGGMWDRAQKKAAPASNKSNRDDGDVELSKLAARYAQHHDGDDDDPAADRQAAADPETQAYRAKWDAQHRQLRRLRGPGHWWR